MPNENGQPLTSAEIANLWSLYMYDTLTVQVKKYMIAKTGDKQIRAVQQEAIGISDKRSKEIASIFSVDNLPIPIGFSDRDVDTEAPRLYSDTFALYHTFSRTRFAMIQQSTALSLTVRQDVKKLFYNALHDSAKLNVFVTQVALDKGLMIRPPIVGIPESPHFVQKPSFMGNIIGKHRPMHVASLTALYLLLLENIIGKALITGFSQVTRNSELKVFFLRGMEIASNQIKKFSTIFSDEDIPVPQSSDSMVTDSATPPFSDKLMLNHIILVNSLAIADLGLAIGQVQRADLVADFMRIAAEDTRYGEDGINIAVKNGWMEAPPQVLMHKDLISDSLSK